MNSNIETKLKNVKFSEHEPLQIALSACLLGHSVRFDGGHKNNNFVTQSLSGLAKLIPVCPEVEMGLGTPRPAMHLNKQGSDIRLLVSRDHSIDHTHRILQYLQSKLADLSEIDGYIFKKNSPSCGLFRVPVVINDNGYKERNGQGLFAKGFIERYPLIPVEEEGRLNDKQLQENFFERVYAYRRWKQIPQAETNVHGFIQFHSRHKLMIMARGSHYYKELGQMVSGTSKRDLQQRSEDYIERFMQVMEVKATPGRHVNVLQHILGYFKNVLTTNDKKELLDVFESYRQNQIPLITPIILLRHYLRIFPQGYINQQHYLQPYPEQLALRSYV